MKEKYIDFLIKLTKKAYKNNDVPVGAIIIKNNKIVSYGYNKKQKNSDVTKHAELIAISKACKKLKNNYLNECELYVSLEPCMMCSGAIIQSHIKKVYYCTTSPKYGYLNKCKNVESEEIKYRQEEFVKILKDFFKEQRQKN